MEQLAYLKLSWWFGQGAWCGVVITAPAVQVAVMTVMDSSGRVTVAIQWMVNVAVVAANESTGGCGQW